MPISKQRHFEILREVLAAVEERRAIPLAVAADMVDLGPAELRDLLDPVLFLEFHVSGGGYVDESHAFVLTADDVIEVNQGHWLRNLGTRPPEPDTALALFVAGTTMQAIATEPTPDLDGALTKLAKEVDVTLRLPVEVPKYLELVQDATAAGRSVRVRYLADGADEPTDRELMPWRVYAKWGHWYVRALAVDRDEPHHYRVDRILDAAMGDTWFDPPADDEIPDWFDLSEHARTFRVWMRADALESLPSPHQLGDAVERDDGTVELDVTVHGDRRLEHMLVSLPSDAEVLSPPQYAALRREHAATLLAAYA
jgi:predicted DNA-binding transcriptional regulator YafY